MDILPENAEVNYSAPDHELGQDLPLTRKSRRQMRKLRDQLHAAERAALKANGQAERAEAKAASLEAQLAAANELAKRQEGTIAALEDEVLQQKLAVLTLQHGLERMMAGNGIESG
ncbi:hypothetical protein ABPG75_004505 [Micractinium tetrahymenae]